MQELLSGVKLRKVEPPPQNFPSLNSHEMLMSQIKSRKIVLKPPVLPAEVKRTARDQIMDFIKSKPRLKACSWGAPVLPACRWMSASTLVRL